MPNTRKLPRERDNYVTAEKVKNAFLGLEMRHETLLKVFAQHNEDFVKQVDAGLRSPSTYSKYCTVYKHLEELIKTRYRVSDIALKELTPAFRFFAKPYCSTDKPHIEHLNKLIRQYIPKGTPFSKISKLQIKTIQNLLNNRPRKKLNFQSPIKALDIYLQQRCT